MTSREVAQAIQTHGPMRGPGFAWLDEVRSRTGYRSRRNNERERYADLLAVSLYPSRGCWFAGVEIKISRADFLRELKAPDKSHAIKRYCQHWWLATLPGVVSHADELPDGWGCMVVKPPTDPVFDRIAGATVEILRGARVLQAEPPTATFVASVLRNASRQLQST